MYSWELYDYLQSKTYTLNTQEYIFVTDIKQHPQINHIKYQPFGDYTEIWTKDGYYFKVNIRN